MGSYSGNCEIVEEREEPGSVKRPGGRSQPELIRGGNHEKPPVLKLGYKDFPEDDINQLFEAISLKKSDKDPDLSCQASTSRSPLWKSAMKRPITVGAPRRSAFGNSESVSLKQALRELCISKAAEMATMKRLSKPIGSPRMSEAGRIKSLYNSVVVETSRSGISINESKGTTVQISLVPEESKSNSSEMSQVSKVKSTSESSLSSPSFQVPKSLNQSVLSSPRFQASKPSNQNADSYQLYTPAQDCNVTKTQNEIVSTPVEVGTQAFKSQSQSTCSSPQFSLPTTQNVTGIKSMPNHIVSASRKAGTLASKTWMVHKDKDTTGNLASCSSSFDNSLKPNINIPTSTKIVRKTSVPKSRKVRLHARPRLAKPITKQRISIKKKIKKGTIATACSSNEGNTNLVPSMGQLLCQKCQCSLKNVTGDASQDFPTSITTSLNSKVSFSNVNSGESKQDFTLSNYDKNRGIARGKRDSKSRERVEVYQSSKSSLGDYSTTTSNSDESNASRPSCCNRPHMSKDFRWEAIHSVKRRDGVLSLRHFNLLKKLGCGDIGTVYLAELIGSNCLFAIKVMDNEFLARRKKMPRAQTEREILRMLDHPFLPTLYAQFTSGNLSCLVMEYCPGGDLHVLRQKQPGRSFPEPAVRFYVAEVLLALEYLHMLGVIYRDLKPENILVREDGHIMLTDFDLSLRCNVSPTLLKSPVTDTVPARVSGPCMESSCIHPLCIKPPCQVSCFSPSFFPAAAKAKKSKPENASQTRSLPQLVAEPSDARSNSFVGTHEYLAPEIIKGEGHGAAVDWWTFGILLYELLYGKTPFKGCGNEETLANVMFQSLKFPDSPIVSFQARDLIRGLLVKDPEHRLGTEKGAVEIKQHPFFEGLNWALIRCIIPPEVPDFLYNFGVPNHLASDETNSNCLECKATGEHLEFELF